MFGISWGGKEKGLFFGRMTLLHGRHTLGVFVSFCFLYFLLSFPFAVDFGFVAALFWGGLLQIFEALLCVPFPLVLLSPLGLLGKLLLLFICFAFCYCAFLPLLL